MKLFAGLVDGCERVERIVAQACFVYVHVARGSISVNGTLLRAGDAARLAGENSLVLDQGEKAEVLVFELA